MHGSLFRSAVHPRRTIPGITHRRCSSAQDLIQHLRSDIEKVDEPQLKAIFETTAEVLSGLSKALSDYERRNESAWKGQA